jgi:predicted ATPase
VARNRLFEAVARLGQALAARTMLVLFIDDVQWADAASLDVLHYLARRFAESETPTLLLLTLRMGERAMGPALAEWRTDMERAVPLTHLQLGPLTAEDICARLDRLTPNAFALLVAGAVLGQGITFKHLCQVADLAEYDGLSALDEVLHSHLLHESEREGGRVTDGRYVFAHAKIRAVVYAEAGEARRSIFHRRALEALQAAAAPAAVLAYQAQAAGLAEPAFHWSLAAGDEAMRVVAVRDAITFYEQARHLMAEPVQSYDLKAMLPAPEIEHLYTHLGRSYELNAEWEKARAVYTVMLAYAQDARQPAMESTALNRLAALAVQ